MGGVDEADSDESLATSKAGPLVSTLLFSEEKGAVEEVCRAPFSCAPFSSVNNHVCSSSISLWQPPRVMLSASMPVGEKRTHVGWENMQARGWRVGHRPRTCIPHRHVLRQCDDAFCDISHAA